MALNKLHSELQKLREEVACLSKDDTESRDKLNRLINELERKLDSEKEDDDRSLMDSMKDALSHFETEHPRATAILNDIMVTLSNMGI
ncbi:MAG: DUF4404 family protein [Gammaproteobacteria bacterium]|nr:DUF4404 family protein [Gammaproteobacteria bacterium]NIO61699.1 DUF4404 family protein [Gammaproteobacteria bacterium]NIP49319.1 DUF4404 family protein [Gammaproteobacteria bacterium]NIQ10541.1 DUF4404 family protein [Gammaproteobacteria bacterium]NIQ18950.1 DUF4404 family protein [Gammaproteobacteria bacterium]